MKFRTTLIIGSVALGSLLAACGDDPKGAVGGKTSEGGSDSSAETTNGGGGGGLDDAAFCEMIRTFMQATDEMSAAYSIDDPKATQRAFETMQDMVAQLDAAAPDSIQGDVHTMRLAIDEMIGIMDKYDYDIMTLSTAPEAEDFATIGDTEEMTAADARLTAYSTDVCGIPTDS